MLLVKKHVACLPLMDVWLLTVLFPNHTIHVAVSDPFIVQPFITPSY